jgi:hypothetical protein
MNTHAHTGHHESSASTTTSMPFHGMRIANQQPSTADGLAVSPRGLSPREIVREAATLICSSVPSSALLCSTKSSPTCTSTEIIHQIVDSHQPTCSSMRKALSKEPVERVTVTAARRASLKSSLSSQIPPKLWESQCWQMQASRSVPLPPSNMNYSEKTPLTPPSHLSTAGKSVEQDDCACAIQKFCTWAQTHWSREPNRPPGSKAMRVMTSDFGFPILHKTGLLKALLQNRLDYTVYKSDHFLKSGLPDPMDYLRAPLIDIGDLNKTGESAKLTQWYICRLVGEYALFVNEDQRKPVWKKCIMRKDLSFVEEGLFQVALAYCSLSMDQDTPELWRRKHGCDHKKELDDIGVMEDLYLLPRFPYLPPQAVDIRKLVSDNNSDRGLPIYHDDKCSKNKQAKTVRFVQRGDS